MQKYFILIIICANIILTSNYQAMSQDAIFHGGKGDGFGMSTSDSINFSDVNFVGAPLTVTVEQEVGQEDPTNQFPILFTVTFSESVSEFTSDDIIIAGTAEPKTIEVTGSGNIFTIASKQAVYAATWTGVVSSAWNNPNNWEPKLVPAITSDVIIPKKANEPIIALPQYCKAMNLQAGATLTIKPKGALTLKGDLTMNGNITILSDKTGTGSLIDNGVIKKASGTFGTAKVQRYLPSNGDRTFVYHYVSSALSAVSHTVYSVSSWNKPNPNFYVYDETVDNEDILAGWNHGKAVAGNLKIGKGYAYALDIDATVEMTGGKFNTGEHSIKVSYTDNNTEELDGWNLVGNPYPSAINAKKFLLENQDVISGAVYFWDDDASGGSDYEKNDYATWNLAGGLSGTAYSSSSGTKVPDGNISCGQGFFVHAKSTTGSPGKDVVFTNEMRTVGKGQFFKSLKSENAEDIVRLRVSISSKKNKLFNETMIVFIDGATDGYDNLYDAIKNFGNPDIGFYSLLKNRALAIQSFGKLNVETRYFKKIPMGYKTSKSGNFVFTALKYENLGAEYGVFLEDKLTGKITDLSEGQNYEFTTDAGTFNDRFVLSYSLRSEPANRPPVVRFGISDAGAKVGENFDFAISKQTFFDVDLFDTLRYSVSLADGGSLPKWLKFDTLSFTFSGTPTQNDIASIPVKITATDSYGASVSHKFTITVEAVTATVELDEEQTEILLYPNPVADVLFIKIAALSGNVRCVVRDNLGRQLLTKRVTGTTAEINMSSFSDGMYFIELYYSGTRTVRKVIVKR